MKAKDAIGFIGGRTTVNGGGYTEGIRNAHSHFYARGEDGKTIDLRKAINQAGIIEIYASDGGIDQNWRTSSNSDLLVEWNDDVGAFVNMANNLILDRSDQMASSPGVETQQYWLSWNVDESKRERVVFDTIGKDWKKLNDFSSNWRWDPIKREFILI